MEDDAEEVVAKSAPTAHFSLDKKDIPKTRNLKTGSRVRIVITGTVSRIAEGKNEYEKDSAEYGDLCVDMRSFSISGNNEISDLLDDETEE
jgi:nucleoside phosphorylase